MNWGGVRRARQLAVAYLIAFPATVAGIVLVLTAQATGHQQLTMPGGVLFVAGQLVINALSFALREVVPLRAGGQQRDGRALAWNRMSLGLEMAGAWRFVRSGEGGLSRG
ncbi:hypothetical protein JOF29_001328 [Kribbella aluminosa]|uniref:Uncharacterized protein n=1 Tax=Kribbella aluminosa TaxID=416017 RepID=A0ABS4UF59_9ACTN|nr:hypothetical protein [Kribbella aluminosa]MBP2350245.1 hypothetical protein [Kribbella aluminosa]